MYNQRFTVPKLAKFDDLEKPWYIYFRFDNKLIRKKYGINYIKNYHKRVIYGNDVVEILHKKLKDGWNPLIKDVVEIQSKMTFLQSLDFAIEKKKPNISNKTYLGYKSIIGFVKTAVIDLKIEKLLITETKRVHVKSILEQITSNRKSTNKSYNKHLTYLQAVLSELIQWDVIETNPAFNIKKLPEPLTQAHVPATLVQHKIIKNHLQSVNIDFFNFIASIFHTGMRPVEILQIQLSMIDLAKQEIVLPPEITKKNKFRIVPINNFFIAILKDMNFENLPKNYYLFGSFREPGKGNVGKFQDFICGPTKITRDTATKRWFKLVKTDLGFKDVTMYSNKHAGANAKILAGIDLDALRELYGHSSKMMTAKYATVIHEVNRKQIMENSPDF